MRAADLPDLMLERTEDDPAPVLAGPRIESIRRKVAAGRRRGLATALAVMSVAGLISLAAYRVAADPAANGLPETLPNGMRLYATETRSLDVEDVVVALEQSPSDILVRCDYAQTNDELYVYVDLRVAGFEAGANSCGGTPDSMFSPAIPRGATQFSLRVGATLTTEVPFGDGSYTPHPIPTSPPDGTITVGFYEIGTGS